MDISTYLTTPKSIRYSKFDKYIYIYWVAHVKCDNCYFCRKNSKNYLR